MSIRKHPIAYLALFISMGGTAYAASSLPPGSVGTRQLRNGAVTNAKVRVHSLTARALAAGVLPRLHTEALVGPAPTGCSPTGCEAQAGMSVSQNAPCPSGTQVVGGGYSIPQAIATDEVASASGPVSGGWQVTFTFTQTPSAPVSGYGTVTALCASVR
jgi:hypothetical protein